VAGAVAATVARYGELSAAALAAVLAAGLVLAGAGLARRAGSAAASVGAAARPWWGWLAALAGWEVYTRLDHAWLPSRSELPTLSDLLDPGLAHPVVRGVATVAWFAAGVWLLSRPRPGSDAHRLRRGAGRDVRRHAGGEVRRDARRDDR
jgi:hypothetical protein